MDFFILLSSLLLLASQASAKCSKLPTFANKEDMPTKFKNVKLNPLKFQGDSAACSDGYVLFILNRGINSFFVADKEIKCTGEETWSLPGGYSFDAKDKIVCIHGHLKDHKNCPLTLSSQKMFLPDRAAFRCPSGNVTVTVNGKKEQQTHLKCDDVEWLIGTRRLDSKLAPIVECQEEGVISSESGRCIVNIANNETLDGKFTSISTPIVHGEELECATGNVLYVARQNSTAYFEKETFECVNGSFVTSTSTFVLNRHDAVVCVAETETETIIEKITVAPLNEENTEELQTESGCRIGIASNDSILGSYTEISRPFVSGEKLLCKSGSDLHFTYNGYAYLFEESVTCKQKKFTTSKNTKVGNHYLAICVAGFTKKAEVCEAKFVQRYSYFFSKLLYCKPGYQALVSNELLFAEGHTFKCVNGIIEDCGLHAGNPTFDCVKQNAQCSVPRFTTKSKLPAIFESSKQPIFSVNNTIHCAVGHQLLVSRRPGKINFIIDEDLSCSNSSWQTPLGNYKLQEQDTITCVPATLADYESCEITLDGQRIYVVNEVACPDNRVLSIKDAVYKQGETISCKNGVLGVCDATFIHRNPEVNCVIPGGTNITTRDEKTTSSTTASTTNVPTLITSTTATTKIATTTARPMIPTGILQYHRFTALIPTNDPKRDTWKACDKPYSRSAARYKDEFQVHCWCGAIISPKKMEEAKSACPGWQKFRAIKKDNLYTGSLSQLGAVGFVSTEQGLCGATVKIMNIPGQTLPYYIWPGDGVNWHN